MILKFKVGDILHRKSRDDGLFSDSIKILGITEDSYYTNVLEDIDYPEDVGLFFWQEARSIEFHYNKIIDVAKMWRDALK